MIYWGPWLNNFLDLLHFEVWWASTSWDICFCFVPGHWRESITCFSSINVTDLNVPSSIQLHRDFILTFWACLNFYVDMMKIYLIIHSILESLHKSLEPQASTNQYDWQPIKKFKKYICIIQLKLNELCIYSNICLKEFLPSIQPSSCSWSPTKQTAMTDM